MKSSFLYISSLDRDTSAYPQVNEFVISLDNEIKNITGIELLNVTFPKSSGLLDEGVVFISLTDFYSDLNNVDTALNSKLQNKIFMPIFLSDNGVNSTFVIPSIEFPYNESYFNSPVNIMKRIGVKVYKNDGTLFSFGEAAGSLDKTEQVHYLFKVNIE